MERESSDEEEDRENLIDPNTNYKPRPSPFDISSLASPISRRLSLHKRLLLALSALLLLLLAFLSLDLRRPFSSLSLSSSPSSPLPDLMRESELRALSLLRSQHSSLLHLWNLTLSSPSNSTDSSPSPSPSISLRHLRFALLKQIRLNSQIQRSLLHPHSLAAANSSVDDDGNVDPALVGFGLDACRRVEWRARNRTIDWKPKPDRFLLAICVSGQMSNHLICLEKHMFFAALLGRVLVLPSPDFDYQYDRVIDVDHINGCFGRKVVLTFEEFSEIKKKHLHVDRFICYVAKPPCYLDDGHIKHLKSLGISIGKIEAAWPDDVKVDDLKKRKVADVLSKFSSDEEVIAIGDVFYANAEQEWVMQPGGPLAHKCKTVIQPSRLIILSAQRFIQTFMGGNFVALHFRRHGFLKFCNAKKESCFFPVPQAAECILRVVERANAPLIYLSTDAADSETGLLQSLTVLDGKTIPLFKRPTHTSLEKWDALLYRSHLGGDDQVEAMLDKTICAMSNVFIGSSGSTFTEDIFRLRKDWGSASVCDEYMCQGEKPNFIVGNEGF